MRLSDTQAKEILDVHNSLWNCMFDVDSNYHYLSWKNQTYQINYLPNKGYASVYLPNSNGTKFLWITQNLNKSSYGSIAIKEARERNLDHRITWVVDNSEFKFTYRSNITTTQDLNIPLDYSTQMRYGIIQIYDDYGTETVWSTDEYLISKKAEF